MSATTHDHHTRLAPSGDPTNTREIRRRFRADVVGRIRDVRGRIRNWAGPTQDVFQTTQSSLSHKAQRADAAAPQDVYEFETDDGKRFAFMRWVRQMLREGVLERAPMREVRDGEHWTATYIRAGYARGWQNATGRLAQAGVGVDTTRSVGAALRLPVAQDQLEALYTRTFSNLDDITTAMDRQISATLTEGLASGWHSSKIADRLTDEVRDIQHTRAEVLARTEVINAYTQSTIDRYQRAGISEVVGQAEWATADDDRVCPICEFLDGSAFAIDRIENGSFQFDAAGDAPDHLAGTYPLRPPVHPQCRCALLPVVN